MVLRGPVLHPRREPPELAVVAVVRHPHLWANEQNLTVVDDDPAVVDHILVSDGPARTMSVVALGRCNTVTNMQMSHRMPLASSDSRILASTSHECRAVSPGIYICETDTQKRECAKVTF